MEEVILQNLIMDREYFSKVFPHLKDSHFGVMENVEIFKALVSYNLTYDESPNVKELGLYIKNLGTITDQIKSKVIAQYKKVFLEKPVENEEFLIQETEKYIQKEELSEAIFKSADLIEKNQPFDPIIGLIEDALSVTFDYDTGMDYKNEDASVDRYEYYTERIVGISLGLPSLDITLGSGLRSKTLNLVVAPSHGGKSALLVSAAATAYLNKKNVLFISLEMTDMEIARRLDANLLHYPANDLGEMNKNEYVTRLKEISSMSGNLIVKDYPAGTFSVLTLKALMNELYAENGFKPDLVCIDYVGLMSSTRISLSQAGGYMFFKSIAEELHGFSKKEDVSIFTAAQLNRGAYDNLESGLDSIADSLGVIQTADNVMALLSNSQLREMGQSLLKMLKNRNTGKLSSHLLEVDFNTTSFTDLDGGDGTSKVISEINTGVLQKAVDRELDTEVINFE